MLCIGTANITGGGSIKKLEQCRGECDLWCIQETKLLTEDERAQWQKTVDGFGFRSEVATCFEAESRKRKQEKKI